jgi:uncharacterized membrane protein HdeD (DUF308 family)
MGSNMKYKNLIKNSRKFYLTGFILILCGCILIVINYYKVFYSLIGIGLLLIALGVNETLKSI